MANGNGSNSARWYVTLAGLLAVVGGFAAITEPIKEQIEQLRSDSRDFRTHIDKIQHRLGPDGFSKADGLRLREELKDLATLLRTHEMSPAHHRAEERTNMLRERIADIEEALKKRGE